MILKKISLHPFAGFLEKEVAFAPGLNVVLGPNDVGKSSLFRAIEAALFLPSKLSRSTKEGRDILPRILPLGSDQAKLRLDFSAGEADLSLEKCWGQSPAVSLKEASGARISEEEKVEERLHSHLGISAHALQNVLFMSQGSLERTVGLLEEKRESLHALGDLLRLTVDQTAGVSVDKVRDLLAQKIEATFSHWDIMRGLPEKGKGIDDPWKKGVGSVLGAYYVQETLRREAALAESLEAERDGKYAALNSKQATREAAREFVSANEKFVESASVRQSLEALLAKTRSESEQIMKDLSAWMQAETECSILAPEIERLEKDRIRLEEEWKNSMARGQSADLLQRYERLKAAQLEWRTFKDELEKIPAIKSEDLKKARAAFTEVDRLKNSLKAGKLQLQFQVKKEFEVEVKKDFESERKGKMLPGKPMTINAGGRIQLTSEYFDLLVSSGEVNTSAIEENLRRASDQLGKLFSELGVSTLDDAQERLEKHIEASQKVKSAEAIIAGVLRVGEKPEDLERAALAAKNQAQAGREAELVRAELQALTQSLSGKREAKARRESQRTSLESRHSVKSSAELTEKMVGKKTELHQLEAKSAALPTLPAEVKQEDFLPRFRRAQAEFASLGEEIRNLSVELAELKARMPEQSAQDLTRALREASSAFTRELQHGRALLSVEAAIKKVQGQAGDLYAGFREEFESQVKDLSAGKYQKIRMAEALPEEFERKDGAAVKFSWLSAGTKDAFALALRLAMAKYFLKSGGFLLVDDPLVNMDPERQALAAKLLHKFAQDSQVVLFTCHPAHAELLGGNLIRLA